jgi:hypothetical protein
MAATVQPWRIAMPIYRRLEPNMQLLELRLSAGSLHICPQPAGQVVIYGGACSH